MTTASAPTIWPIALIASQFTAAFNHTAPCAVKGMPQFWAIRRRKTIS